MGAQIKAPGLRERLSQRDQKFYEQLAFLASRCRYTLFSSGRISHTSGTEAYELKTFSGEIFQRLGDAIIVQGLCTAGNNATARNFQVLATDEDGNGVAFIAESEAIQTGAQVHVFFEGQMRVRTLDAGGMKTFQGSCFALGHDGVGTTPAAYNVVTAVGGSSTARKITISLSVTGTDLAFQYISGEFVPGQPNLVNVIGDFS